MLHGRAILPACEAAVRMVADEGLAGLEIKSSDSSLISLETDPACIRGCRRQRGFSLSDRRTRSSISSALKPA
jgi:hypothetical protein